MSAPEEPLPGARVRWRYQNTGSYAYGYVVQTNAPVVLVTQESNRARRTVPLRVIECENTGRGNKWNPVQEETVL